MQKLKKLTGLLLALGIVLLAFSVTRNYFRLQKAKGTIEEARMRVEKLEKEENELKTQLSEAESQEFIEKQLRDKLGMAKEGEVVLVLPEESVLRTLAPRPVVEEEYKPQSNWRKWISIFN